MSSEETGARRAGRYLATAFAGASLVLLFGSLLALVIAWIRDPEFLASTEKVLKALAGIIPGTAVAAVVTRHLKRRLREHRWNVSAAFSSWLAHEPILLAVIWVFVAVELVALSFFIPIYALRVEIVDPEANWSRVRVTARPPDAPFVRETQSADRALYRTSTAGYRWGDSVTVNVAGGSGFADKQVPVQWSGFAFLQLVSGYSLGVVELQSALARVELRPTPSDAVLTIRQGDHVQVARGPQVLNVPRGTIEVTARAEGRQGYSEHVLIKRDTMLEIPLPPLPGRVKLLARNAIGEALTDLDVFVDGQRRGRVGDVLTLTPGSHEVRMQVCRANGLRLVVDAFAINVRAGRSDSVVKIARGEECVP